MEITFVRHGPPDFDSSRWLHRYSLKHLLIEYDASRVVSPAPAGLMTIHYAHTEAQVCCSTTPRSIDSAKALGFPEAVQLSELNEADLPCPSWLKFPIPYRASIVALRLAWFLGYSGGLESYRSTLIRASDAAAILINIAGVHGRVLVIGHGIMNRLVCRKLKEIGWTVEAGGQSGYWSTIRVFVLGGSERHW